MPEQFSPIRLFATLLVLIFCTEGATMLALDYAAPRNIPAWLDAIIDASVLTALMSVFIWRLFMRPLRFALMSEAARARAIMDTATEGIIVIDEHGIVESFNRAAELMFARKTGDVVGKNVTVLMPGPQAAGHDGYIADYLRTGEARAIGRPREVMALRKDGTEFPIELNVTEIRTGGTRHFTGIFRDVTERKLAEERIQQLAYYDSLTGIPNRTLFYDRLSQAINIARRDRHPLALLYLDLDKFKPINDTLGHEAGDEVLRIVADRVRRRGRESDTISRVGGDEFTVILPKIAGPQDASNVAEKIIEALRSSIRLSRQSREVSLGVSIGIAIFPDDAADMDALVRAADAAMYKAKQTGNACRFSGA